MSTLFPVVAGGTIKSAALNHLADSSVWFAQDVGTSGAYQVAFSGNAPNYTEMSSLNPGQLIHFVANSISQSTSTLTVDGSGGALTVTIGGTATSAIPLTRSGGASLETGDIGIGQMVAVLFNAGQNRFEMVSSPAGPTDLSAVSGSVSVAHGGTGASTAVAARTALGAAPASAPSFTGSAAVTATGTTDSAASQTLGFTAAGFAVRSGHTYSVAASSTVAIAAASTTSGYGRMSVIVVGGSDWAELRCVGAVTPTVESSSTGWSSSLAVDYNGTGAYTLQNSTANPITVQILMDGAFA